MNLKSVQNLKNSLATLHEELSAAAQEVVSNYRNGVSKEALVHELKELNLLFRQVVSKAHAIQKDFEWNVPPVPEWFDHYEDQHYQWHEHRNPLWLERGIFSLLAMPQGGETLELCCGDGFNAYHFYSIRCQNIIAVDFDASVIAHAKSYNQAPNITYKTCDIRTEIPHGQFDNVIWDGAMEHFKESEIALIMAQIKARLKPHGVLSGYTIREQKLGSGQKSLTHHEYEFQSKEDLARFFVPHFKNVKVFETVYPTRHNLYFFCSDSTLPFDPQWSHLVHQHRL